MAWLAEEIIRHLHSAGVGNIASNLFAGRLPDAPDSALAVIPYGGREPMRAFRGGAGQAVAERPRFQVLTRSSSLSAALSASYGAMNALDGLGHSSISAVTYLWIEALESPFVLDRDENERVIIACNYEAVKRLS